MGIAETLPFLNARIGVMVVNAFEVLGFDSIPGHPRIGVEPQSHVSHKIFDKYRIFVRSLGDRLFVLAFQQSIKLRTRGTFNHRNQVFNPNNFVGPDLDGDFAALIVRPIFGNRFGAGAKRRDVGFDREDEIFFVAPL